MIDHGLKLYEDGTLQITLPKGTMVRRVLVGEEGSHFCEVMYPKTGSGISKDLTYEQVMEYCKKRCLSLVTNEFLAKMPSAQPEIIACGDCKHWICHDRRCGYWNHGVKPLDWCCHAERRTDDKTNKGASC